MPRLAEAILEILQHAGVDTVFGVPGNHNIELYRYLPDFPINHVTAHHEQGAGFMADGYARVRRTPGVCFVVTGPGLTNILTAMGQALADSVPLVVIATVGDQQTREGRLHELPDQLQLAAGASIEAVQPRNPESAIKWLQKALVAHHSARPGPRYIQIPLSWWQLEVASLGKSARIPRPLGSLPDLEGANGLLDEALRPVIIAGGGSQAAGPLVQQLAERLGAPVVNTVNAKGLISASHPLWVGGSPSLPGVRDLLSAADVLIVIGSELGETDFDLLMLGDITWTQAILRIDIDEQQLRLNVTPTVGLPGDAAQVLAGLLDVLPVQRRSCWFDVEGLRRADAQYQHNHPDMAAFFAAIDAALPTAVVVGDSTRPTYYATWMWERSRPATYFHSASGFGTLGYALPAAIGAQIAQPDVPVVALIGDGGLLFTLGELAVAVEMQVPVKIIVWNNSGFQEIANSMTARGIDAASTQYRAPDFEQIAAGFGATVRVPADLEAFSSVLSEPLVGPVVIVVNEHDFVHQPSGAWY
ncbi:MAG: 5-guanidino-2-oxopentanoate decarboxylase [bacterium]